MDFYPLFFAFMIYLSFSSIASAETLDIPLENIEEHLNNLKDSFKVLWAGVRIRGYWSVPNLVVPRVGTGSESDLFTKLFSSKDLDYSNK